MRGATIKRGLCQRAGVPAIRFHDLRHLHNTILMRRNVNAGIVKSRAGHSSVAFWLDRYAWAFQDREEQQVAVGLHWREIAPAGQSLANH